MRFGPFNTAAYLSHVLWKMLSNIIDSIAGILNIRSSISDIPEATKFILFVYLLPLSKFYLCHLGNETLNLKFNSPVCLPIVWEELRPILHNSVMYDIIRH